MTTQVKAITLRAKYESDLSGFKSDLAAIKSFRRNLEKMPLKVPVRLDLSGIRSEAHKAAAEIKKAITGAMSTIQVGGATSKGGIIIPASAMKEMEQFAATGKGAFKEVRNESGKLIQSYEQLAAGIQRITTVGKKSKNVKLVDTRPLEAFQEKLASIEKMNAKAIGTAKGTGGDVAGALRKKQQEISAALQDKDLAPAVKNHPVYLKAERSLNRLEERIASLTGSQDQKSARQVRAGRIDELKDTMLVLDKLTAKDIAVARGSGQGLASILGIKRKVLETQLAKFSDIADSPAYRQAQKSLISLQGGEEQSRAAKAKSDAKEAERQARRNAAAKKADYLRRTDSFIARQDNAVNRNQQKYLKAEESIAKRLPDRVDREEAINRVMDRRMQLLEQQISQYRRLAEVSKQKGYGQAAAKYTGAANRLQGEANQISLDRTRTETGRMRAMNKQALDQQLARVQNGYRLRMEELKNQEAQARGLFGGKKRQAALREVDQARGSARQDAMLGLHQVWREAGRRGDTGLRQRAENSMLGIEKQGVAGMRKLASATRSSGHAFAFHTSSLLKNAATFTQWYVPAQAAMGVFSAIGKGIGSAVDAQRTFKILDAVFRGTGEDSKMLADQTLVLAAANGRSVQEAADASVAWARMGLTRTQILVAMESSLRAANVAEISAAEATAYLTANYKAFGQTIAEIPATLDYINALSNKNAVAPKEIFEGLSRSAVIAKEAGITFQELSAIIATVSAETQRPGAEIGNAVKSLSTRLRRPAVVKKLKEEFGYDVTDGAGDAKKMTQILGELAAIYPTLNRLEKGRMEDMVAGAHQGNRFAVIMGNWNEALGAQADAGLDANSAMRENAKILDSVSAKLETLSTSWTRMFHSMGEAGVFDTVSDGLTGVSMAIDTVTHGISVMGQMKKNLKPGLAKSALTGIENIVPFVSPVAGLVKMGSMRNAEIRNRSTTIARTTSARRAEEVTGIRTRTEALGAMAAYFKGLSGAYGADGFSKDKQVEGFDKRMAALTSAKDLPGAAALANEGRKNLRPLLMKGDTAAAREGLATFGEKVRGLADAENNTLSSKTTTYLKETESSLESANQQIEKFNEELANTDDAGAQERIQQKLGQTTDDVKALSDNLATLRKEFTMPVESAYTDPMKERMTRFIEETKLASKVYGGLLDEFSQTGFANLDATLAGGAAAMNLNMLRQAVDATSAQNAAMDAQDAATMARLSTSPRGIVEPAIKQMLAEKERRDSSLAGLKEGASNLADPTAEALREIEMKRQAELVRTGYNDARRFTSAGFGRFETGRSDGERLTSRGFGILGQIQADIANPALGSGNSVQDARELGSLTERMTQAKETYFSMEDRINRALAERVNLEGDIAEEVRKQNEEASRRLAMASREDQLRSAAAAAVLAGRGKSQFSMDEFQFFSEGTRNAISSFNPGTVKGLDEAEKSRNERRADLDNETRGLSISIRAFRDALESVLPKAEEKAGGILDVNNPLSKNAPTGGAITDLNKNEIRMNLNTGPITVNLDFGRHVQDIKTTLQTHLDAKLDALRAEYRRFRADMDPNTSAASSTL